MMMPKMPTNRPFSRPPERSIGLKAWTPAEGPSTRDVGLKERFDNDLGYGRGVAVQTGRAQSGQLV